MAKDRKPEQPRGARGGSGRSGAAPGRGSSSAQPSGTRNGGGKGRKPAANVVSPQRPWGMIAAAIAVVVFAGGILTYAVLQVREAEAEAINAIDEIPGLTRAEPLYGAGQAHVTTSVDYPQSPPVGGEHDGEWADCTGTVYDVDIRDENAVHSLEHGAVWLTYNPDEVSDDDIATLADLVEGEAYRMMSPYEGLDSTVSIQSWNHQLKVDSADDPRIEQFADFLTLNANVEGGYPEIGATCENPLFLTDPLLAGEGSRGSGATATHAPSGT